MREELVENTYQEAERRCLTWTSNTCPGLGNEIVRNSEVCT